MATNMPTLAKPAPKPYCHLDDPDYKSLTILQRRFIDEYILDPTNITQACKRAGYKAANGTEALGIYHNANVQNVLTKHFVARAESNLVTKERILNELAIISFSNIDYFTVDPLSGQVQVKPGVPEYAIRAIQAVKVRSTTKTDEKGNEYVSTETEIKLWSKTTALSMLAEHMGIIGRNSPDTSTPDSEKKQVWKFGDKEILI